MLPILLFGFPVAMKASITLYGRSAARLAFLSPHTDCSPTGVSKWYCSKAISLVALPTIMPAMMVYGRAPDRRSLCRFTIPL